MAAPEADTIVVARAAPIISTWRRFRNGAFLEREVDTRRVAGKMDLEDAGGLTMRRDELLSRISIDPNVCFGRPCIRGHRIWVSLILDLLASGMATEEILTQYPGVEEADVRACLAYAAEMARERVVDIPPE